MTARRTSDRLALISLGDFGHTYAVLDDLRPDREHIDFLGVYPAYREEQISESFLAHPFLAGISAGDFDNLPDAPHENSLAIVSTRLDRQAETAVRAARKGWHLVVEKPIATTEADLENLHREIQHAGRRIMTMLTMRSIPAFRRAREVVESGRLGKLGLINLRKSYKWGSRPSWFGDAAKYPGTISWVGIHAMDLMAYLSGQRITEVSAAAENLFHPTHPACEDAASLILRGSEGLLGSASIDLLRPASAEGHGDDWMRLIGEHGIIEGGPAPRTLQIDSPEGSTRIDDMPLSLHPIFRDFASTLSGPREPDEDIGFHLTDACLAAHRSLKDGSRQRIDPDRWRFTSH